MGEDNHRMQLQQKIGCTVLRLARSPIMALSAQQKGSPYAHAYVDAFVQ
jgi:hypothetical protein